MRRQVLETVAATRKGHLGGTFSCTDIFVALYYGGILRFDPRNPRWKDRDRFVVGKGHACLALYHIWVDQGFFGIGRLKEYGVNGGDLSGQLNLDTPGVEYNSGSLGNALGIAAGMALACRLDHKRYRTFAMVGDGECAEGSIWESLMFAGQQKLKNLIGIIDCNKLSVTARVEDGEGGGCLRRRVEACGWKCIEIDGHSFKEILAAFQGLDRLTRPLMVIAHTVKGKGVSFMEDGIKWHHSVPTKEEIELARKELALA